MIGCSQRCHDWRSAIAATIATSAAPASFLLTNRIGIHAHRRAPLPIRERRDLRRLDLAAAAPDHARPRDRAATRLQMLVDRLLVREHEILLRPVRHRHDVHVAELRAALAPVAMREDVEASDLASRLHLASRRHGPMKEPVEARHALAGLQRLHVLEKRREAADDLPRVQRLRDFVELLERHARLGRALLPDVAANLLRRELALERRQHAPLQIRQLDLRRVLYLGQLLGLAAGLHPHAAHVADAEGEDALGGHHAEMLGPGEAREHRAILVDRVALRDFDGRPQPVIRARRRRVGRARDDVAGERILLKHVVDRAGAEHRADALEHRVDVDARLLRDDPERVAHEALDLILGDREDFCVSVFGVSDDGHVLRQFIAMKLFALARALVIAPLFILIWLRWLPLWLLGPNAFADPRPLGWIVVAVGAVVGIPCVWEFAWRGFGTPAPFDPPRKLVVSGPYRYVRNPMYVGMGVAIAGFGIVFPHATNFFFAELGAAFALVFAFIVLYEEPMLRRMFGDDYLEYCRNVRRWIPRVSPWYASAHLD